jgi:GNAT superfamily N-acetyltransferase
MGAPEIRAMTAADVAPATAMILAAGWGDRRLWFEFATGVPECHPVVAIADGEIVGTGVGAAHGAVGWIGAIVVTPARRGRGLGRALTAAVIDELERVGCRSLVLVASTEGRRLYERMGFAVQTHYRILEAPGIENESGRATVGDSARRRVGLGVRPFERADLTAMCTLDAEATGEDRAHVLRRFASPDSCRVLPDPNGGLQAFVVRAPWGGGATIARHRDAAMAILRARRLAAGSDWRVRVGLIEENAEGLAAVLDAGFSPIWSAPRLVRGAPFEWHPDWIWGQFNHAMG